MDKSSPASGYMLFNNPPHVVNFRAPQYYPLSKDSIITSWLGMFMLAFYLCGKPEDNSFKEIISYLSNHLGMVIFITGFFAILIVPRDNWLRDRLKKQYNKLK